VQVDGPTARPELHYHTLSLVRNPANVLMPLNFANLAAQHGTRVEVLKGERMLVSYLISTWSSGGELSPLAACGAGVHQIIAWLAI